MTQEEFAGVLGVARRTIAAWHERPEVVIRAELQRALDTAYERAPEQARSRFIRELRTNDDPAAGSSEVVLTVAIAVVVADARVLIVCRRDPDPSGITWQFPAGIVKPGATAGAVAVRETLDETGVHCCVRTELGVRTHPLTGVRCQYFLCDYLAGDVENRDPSENIDAIWVERRNLSRFIHADTIFPPILHALNGAS
jgi:8-oxo-dGTP pyrophosphatase MutT (NUDIX family)